MTDAPITTLPGKLRRREMLAAIEAQGFVRVSELSKQFGISEVTVRSDLDQLERSNSIERVHGGVLSNSSVSMKERSFEEVSHEQAGEKAAIGRVAAGMISSGDSIILDVGTTATAVADALVQRKDIEDVIVFTNGITTALKLEPEIPRYTVILMGGVLRPRQHSLVQPMSGEWLERLNANIAFIGCNGIDVDSGVTNVNVPEAHVKQMMVGAARRVVVVADGSKLGKTSLVKFADVDDIDVVVTTSSATDEGIEAIRSANRDVILADNPQPASNE